MRGATAEQVAYQIEPEISTHTPHAGRDCHHHSKGGQGQISTHTPHAGRDDSHISAFLRSRKFLLTRPMRGATSFVIIAKVPNIQFLLTRPMRGATAAKMRQTSLSYHFYSHAPCGARLILRK